METKREYDVGDLVPLDQAEKSDTYYLLTFAGKKYLVNQDGRVVLKQPDSAADFLSPSRKASPPQKVRDGAEMGRPESDPAAAPLKLRVKPGTPQFVQAVQEAESVLLSFVDMVRKFYPALAPRFEAYIENTRVPYVKYFERAKDGLANIKAYLAREFFRRTTAAELGLEFIEFLTAFIARRMDGGFSRDRDFSSAERQALLRGFLDFAAGLQEKLFPRPEAVTEDNPEDFIAASLNRILAVQLERLATPQNRPALEAEHRRQISGRMDFFRDNLLACLKALATSRLLAAAEEAEAERLLYAIIAYRPSWYS